MKNVDTDKVFQGIGRIVVSVAIVYGGLYLLEGILRLNFWGFESLMEFLF